MSTDLDETGGTRAVIDTAIQSVEPTFVDAGTGTLAIVTVPPGGSVQTIDLAEKVARHQTTPTRKTGQFSVHDAASFVAYLSKHGVSDTEVWADIPSARIVGVVNAHGNDQPGWADHRVTYAAQHTDAWKAWIANDGKLMGQVAFAEHIEDRSIDIVRPVAADMLELAQTFQATVGVSFESSKLLSSGERQVEYRETVDAKAGKAGRLEIPKDFDIALIPFEGADAYKVRAHFRFRITDGELKVGYRLERPADVLREAFLGVVDSIASQVEAPVFRGSST